MTGPWERYGQGAPSEGPWAKYRPSAAVAEPEAPTATGAEPAVNPAIADLMAARSAPQQSAPSAAERGFSERAGRQLMLGTQATGRGLAHAALGLGDLTNTGLNLGLALADKGSRAIGGPDISYRLALPSQTIINKAASTAEGLGIPLATPETGAERFVGNAIDIATQGGAGGIAGALRPAIPAAEATHPANLVADLVAPVREMGARTVVGDIGAGLGMAGAETMLDRERLGEMGALGKVIETLAPLAGGVVGAGAASAARGVAGRGVDELNALRTGADPEHAVDAAARRVQAAALDPRAAARTVAENAADLRGQNIETLPAAGYLADDRGLSSLVDRAGRAGATATRLAERERDVATEARKRLDDIERGANPAAAGAYADAQAATMREADNHALSEVQNRIAANDTAAAAMGARLAEFEGDRRASAGAALDHQVVEGSLRPMVAEKNRLFAEAGRSAAPVSTAPLAQAAASVREGAAALPEGLRGQILPESALAAIDGLEGAMPLRGVVQMRPILGAQEAAARQAGNYPLADNLRALKTGIGDAIYQAARDGEPSAAAATDYHRNTFGPVWSRGPGDAASEFRRDFNRDPNNRSTTPPSKTAERFLSSPEKAQALARILESAPNPRIGYAAAREFLLSDMAATGVRDAASGRINLGHLRRWINRNDETARAIPGFRDELDGIARQATERRGQADRLAAELEAAKSRQGLTEKEIRDGVLGLMTDRDPRNLVEGLLGSPDPARALRDAAALTEGSPEARRGLTRAIAAYIGDTVSTPKVHETTGGARPLSPAKLENLLTRFGDALAEALPPGEMQRLRATQAQLRPSMQRGRGVTRPDAQEPGRGAAAPAGAAAGAALGSSLGPVGAALAGHIGAALGDRFSGRLTPRADRLLRDALVEDPNMLAKLLTRDTRKAAGANWRANSVIGAALGLRNAEE